MGKILFWAVVIVVVMIGLRLWSIAQRNARRRDDAPPGNAGKSSHRDEPMVRCVRCGVFLPRDEARLTHNGYRCTDEACNRHD